MMLALVSLLLFFVSADSFRRFSDVLAAKNWLFNHIALAQGADALNSVSALAEVQLYRYGRTGGEQHLKWAQDLVAETARALNSIRPIAREGPEWQARIARIETLVARHLTDRLKLVLDERERLGESKARMRLLARLDDGDNYLSAELVQIRRVTLQEMLSRAQILQRDIIHADGVIVVALILLTVVILLYLLRRFLAERKKAEAAIRASEERIRTIVENIFDALIIADPGGKIETANGRTGELLGYQGEVEFEGSHLSLLFPPGYQIKLDAEEESAGAVPLGRIKEMRAQHRLGHTIPVELVAREIHTKDGKRILVTMRDISARHELDRIRREFVAMVTHELKTPLTSIMGTLGLLEAGALGPVPEKACSSLAAAQRSVDRMVRLTNDLLDLEKIAAGAMDMEFSQVDVGQIIERSVEAVGSLASDKAVTIQVEQTEEIYAEADADRLVQVVINLLSNAVKFSPPQETVTVSVSRSGQLLLVRVIDRGRGVPLKLQEAIFERFQQVEPADRYAKGGTGLGLAICKAIVEQHGGNIGLDSREGQGAAFWFRIPLKRASTFSQ